MKKVLYFLMTCVLLGYSDSQESPMSSSMTGELSNEKVVAVDHRVSQDEAAQISDAYRSQFAARSGVSEIASVEYVLAGATRSQVLESDTVAYIFNYADRQGFTIVAADDRVNPILAYSHEGYYANDNIIAKEAFVDRLGVYMAYKIQAYAPETVDPVWDGGEGCAAVAPVVKGFMDQGAPFNKYITAEGCVSPLAGCVAVAGVTAMLYGANSIKYHGSTFNLKNIREGFVEAKKQNVPRKYISGAGVEPPYTYSRAVDSIAKLLFWYGKDADIQYGDIRSGGDTADSQDLLTKFGFTTTAFLTYSAVEVAAKLIDGYIINVRGSGHSWIIDGCQYCLENGEVVNPIMHCDWGWGGAGNGYFHGGVFDPKVYGLFAPTHYYGVKKTTRTINTGR